MKTIKSITVLLGTFALLCSLNLNATAEDFCFEEEVYINDIPFNTGCVTADYLYEKAINEEYNFEEESYISDIPFDTECMTIHCHYERAINVNFSFEEESCIDDIPFNTYAILSNKKYSSFALNK